MIKLAITYLLQYKKSFVFYIILSFVLGVISLFTPLVTGSIINNITSSRSVDNLIYMCILFSSISITKILLQFISQKLYIFTQSSAAFKMNLDVIEHVERVSLKFINSQETVYLNQRINNDSNNIIIFTISLINNFTTNILSLLFSIFLLFQISIIIGLVLSLLLIIYLLMYLLFKKKLYTMSLLNKESQSKFFSALNEQLMNVKFIKEHSVYHRFTNKLIRSFEVFLKNITKSQLFIYLYSSLDSIICLIAQIFVFFTGGIYVINGNLEVGTFTILISYFQILLNSIKYFSSLGTNYQDSIVSYQRIIDILNLKEQSNGTKKIKKIQSIKLSNLSFKYNKKSVIKNFSYSFYPGKIYGIIGNNGVGKSTLLELIAGLYIDEYEGSILYNDTNIKDIDMIDLRLKKISFLEQEPTLTNDSVGKNILLTEHHNRKNCSEIINKLALSDFFLNLSDGFKTKINEKSSNISGGEKQKIALVRLLCKNSDLIICDEPTSALDLNSKLKLMTYLSLIKKDKIIIMIAHDEKMLMYYDIVIQL